MSSVGSSRKTILRIGLLVALFAWGGYADSLVLVSQVGGLYDYGIQLDANHGIVFLPGNEIILKGLFEVTSASVLPNLAFAFSTAFATGTSAAIIDTLPIVLDPIPVTHTLAAIRIASSAAVTGPIRYEIETGGGGIISGAAPGPVAPVPEAGSLTLVAGGFAAFATIKISLQRGSLAISRASLGPQS